MDLTSRGGQFRFYFGASYGSAQTALRQLEEPHVMLSYATANNTVWPLYSRYQKSRPSLFIDNGAYSVIDAHGGYQTTIQEYIGYVDDATTTVEDTDDVRYALRDVPTNDEVLDELGITVATAQHLTVEYHKRTLQAARRADLDARPYTVVQGEDADDYLAHLEAHADAGTLTFDVGIGSLAGRAIEEVREIVTAVHNATNRQVTLHGFGITPRVLVDGDVRWMLDSADSSKWSYGQYSDRVQSDERVFHLMSKKYVDAKRLLTALFGRDQLVVEPGADDDIDLELCGEILTDALEEGEISMDDATMCDLPLTGQPAPAPSPGGDNDSDRDTPPGSVETTLGQFGD